MCGVSLITEMYYQHFIDVVIDIIDIISRDMCDVSLITAMSYQHFIDIDYPIALFPSHVTAAAAINHLRQSTVAVSGPDTNNTRNSMTV